RASFGRNRRWVNTDGVSTMYGRVANPAFSHVEGGDDSSVNVLATYDRAGDLTGLVLNVACPAQVSEALSVVTADYWHETRLEVRQRWGEKLYILPQISAAGDQAPHFTNTYNYDHRAEARMLTLYGR